jgi:hypothetical protein
MHRPLRDVHRNPLSSRVSIFVVDRWRGSSSDVGKVLATAVLHDAGGAHSVHFLI